ncbi:MAG: hypothetical protein LBP24_01655 [Coriobacteriales bacterium]|jgi:hypothetical protein|nr:hypothetical protein [Coriobacteriales bacterium]
MTEHTTKRSGTPVVLAGNVVVEAEPSASGAPATGSSALPAPAHLKRSPGLALRRLGKRIFKPANPLFTLSLLVALVAIVAVVVYLAMQVGTCTITEPVYYYNTGIRAELEGESKVFRSEDDNIVDFTLRNAGTTLALTDEQSRVTLPLYWRDEQRMLLPAMMSITQPSCGVRPTRTGFYTELRAEGDGFMAKIDNRELPLDSGFLFDGQSLYVFLEDMTVSFLGQSVEMPAMSYAVVISGLRVELYPYGGTPVVQQTGPVPVSAEGGDYSIDMTNDILQTPDEQILLFTTPSILDVAQ